MIGRLNKKKVIIAVLIAILLIAGVTVFIVARVKTQKEDTAEEDLSGTEIFTDVNGTVSLEMAKKYELTQSYNSEYLIKLSSEDYLDIYVSKLDNLESSELSTIARADRLAYLEEYNTYSNLSDLKQLEINGNEAYTYSFHYLDENLNKAFYLQVILLKANNTIYVFDIDFPLDELVYYTSLPVDTVAEFKIL